MLTLALEFASVCSTSIDEYRSMISSLRTIVEKHVMKCSELDFFCIHILQESFGTLFFWVGNGEGDIVECSTGARKHCNKHRESYAAGCQLGVALPRVCLRKILTRTTRARYRCFLNRFLCYVFRSCQIYQKLNQSLSEGPAVERTDKNNRIYLVRSYYQKI